MEVLPTVSDVKRTRDCRELLDRWLALCENHYAWVDPALPIALKRRRALYVKFGRKLESHFLRPRQYPYDVLGPLTSDQRSCFHRWQAYVQTRACRRGCTAWRAFEDSCNSDIALPAGVIVFSMGAVIIVDKVQ